LVGATFLVYVLVSVANDPLARLATCTNCDQAAYDRIIDLYDLDQPIPVRFLGWIGSAVQGDLGVSTSLGSSRWDRSSSSEPGTRRCWPFLPSS
jgi:peptide/nickel transport system permease protein